MSTILYSIKYRSLACLLFFCLINRYQLKETKDEHFSKKNKRLIRPKIKKCFSITITTLFEQNMCMCKENKGNKIVIQISFFFK